MDDHHGGLVQTEFFTESQITKPLLVVNKELKVAPYSFYKSDATNWQDLQKKR